ncbi:MAG: ferrous iron transport protein A [Fischerella sp. CENA71]|nr:ferrous iron transport protein A [Fischerella sp. CENA71]
MFKNFSITGSSLELLKIRERGIILFCNTQDEKIINQVISLGLNPGICFTLEQDLPNIIIKVNEQKLVVHKEIASKIYVRIVNR